MIKYDNIYIYVDIHWFIYIYVSVNLCNQAIRGLTENFRQFVKCLFQSVNLFFYACKTLKPGLFWYAVEREPVRLESTNPKKKIPRPWMLFNGGPKPPIKGGNLWNCLISQIDANIYIYNLVLIINKIQ